MSAVRPYIDQLFRPSNEPSDKIVGNLLQVCLNLPLYGYILTQGLAAGADSGVKFHSIREERDVSRSADNNGVFERTVVDGILSLLFAS